MAFWPDIAPKSNGSPPQRLQAVLPREFKRFSLLVGTQVSEGPWPQAEILSDVQRRFPCCRDNSSSAMPRTVDP